MDAVFDVGGEQTYRFLKLDQTRFKPIINILVTMGKMPNGLPKATIKKEGETIATASLNWEGRYFGEIGVETKSSYRRQGYGQSVVAALCQYLIDRGKGVVFVVAAENTPSIQLAESLGFIDTHHTEHLIELTAR